mmetsp:Transcript_37273/g.27518  ORF Transcript_37273/g.27518 Transcript_37273/m.27518 type:complete len:86 (+) Transcript_37273:53-310(+)
MDLDNLAIIQQIFRNLKRRDPPDSIRKCKKGLRKIFIHVQDYIDGNYEKKFRTKAELRGRCREIETFDKSDAKRRGLNSLLRKLH